MNLVIIEDSELILQQLLRLLAACPSVQVAGWAANEERAVQLILGLRPDVVLMDLALADGNGVSVLRRIRSQRSPARVFVLSNHNAEILRATCESFGIEGFYDKSHEVEACLAQVMGSAWIEQGA